MKIYRVWRGEQDMGLYVAHNEREAAAEAANDAGVGLTDGFVAYRWRNQTEPVETITVRDQAPPRAADH